MNRYPDQPPQSWTPANAPAGAYPAQLPSTSGLAIASLIMSILGFVAVPVICSILGVIFGHMALREIERSNGLIRGDGWAKAGLIAGYVALGLEALGLAILAVVAVLHFF